MSIELHCPNCAKHIRAPDEAGGKRGKCPGCGGSLYIPMPVTDDDLIPLAPVDEDDERRAEELRMEAAQYAATLDKAGGGEGGDEEPSGGRARGGMAEAPGEVVDYGDLAGKFVVAMKNSKLDEAERIATRLKRAGIRARDHVESMFLDQMTPNIKDVPPPLVKGFLKALLERLS
jgi:hypothetical protein